MTAAHQPHNEPGTDEQVPQDPMAAEHPVSHVPRRGTRQRDLRYALGLCGFLAVMGLPLGILWALLVPRVELVHVQGGWAFTEENPEQYMAADGVFSLLGFAVGIAVAITVWIALRRRRGPLLLLGLVMGSILCQTVAWRFGRMGRDTYQATLDSVPVGWHVRRAPELLMVDFNPFKAFASLLNGDVSGMFSHLALGVLATMAFTAAFTYTMCAGWSKMVTLRKNEEPIDDDVPSPIYATPADTGTQATAPQSVAGTPAIERNH